MRDPGLSEAIEAVGGVGSLARLLGISQPSVSNWSRVPAQRILAVEAVTGVSRARLRPDLYGEGAGQMSGEPEEVEAARAREYALLSTLLARTPEAGLLARLSDLRGDATPLGIAHAALGEAASRAVPERVEREFFNLFIGVGRGELLPYGSYYLTGFLHERPLARLREDLAKLGIERVAGQAEPEDHIAILCEIMAGIASGQFAASPGADRQIFERHIDPWAGRFFADLEQAEAADFYRSVGTIGRVFVEIEREAFALPS
ncbi:MAG TPA: Cro/CI family transcriptional regulator [Xanthobacteraceae bacterium]|nr:Cro/CI family transcriptional regulator [Xanthobacteraceae bacterium]